MTHPAILQDVGVVVIGRNEGERLVACLDSLRGQAAAIVYADSASTDGSPQRARERGVEVVALDREHPLNAARGRNAGFARLVGLRPEVRYVFFVDGDCRVAPGFLDAARAELERDPHLGAVCGRRREIRPEATVFNRAVDIEWNTPVGPAESFGGDVLVRVSAVRACGGYRESMNQGEDPEFACRLRRAGFGILRVDRDMTWHDVALLRWTAWRRRHQRGGYAYAHGALLHWRDPGRHSQRALVSILAWGAAIPLVALLAVLPTRGLSLGLFGAYALLWARIRGHRLRAGDTSTEAARYAALIVFGKLDEALGVLRCFYALAAGREALQVDYKGNAGQAAGREAA